MFDLPRPDVSLLGTDGADGTGRGNKAWKIKVNKQPFKSRFTPCENERISKQMQPSPVSGNHFLSLLYSGCIDFKGGKNLSPIGAAGMITWT